MSIARASNRLVRSARLHAMLGKWLLLVVLSCAPAYAQSDLERCQQKAQAIKTGMTRGDVQQLASWDGGISGIYKEERFYFRDFYLSGNRVCKLVIDFRPK